MKLTSKLIELKHTRYALRKARAENKPMWIRFNGESGVHQVWASKNAIDSWNWRSRLTVKTPQGWRFVYGTDYIYTYDYR